MFRFSLQFRPKKFRFSFAFQYMLFLIFKSDFFAKLEELP